MKPPPPADPKNLKQAFAERDRFAKASRIVSVQGGKLKEGTNGTTLVIDKPRNTDTVYVHPWKAASNGDDTVSVGYGSLLSYEDNYLTLREFLYFAGFVDELVTPVTVTGAGSIYGRVDAAASTGLIIDTTLSVTPSGTVDVDYLRTFPDSTDTLTFSFETTVPGNTSTDYYFEIAKVDLVDSVAVITRQVLTHNPTLVGFVEPA